jgi:hypothetical protein
MVSAGTGDISKESSRLEKSPCDRAPAMGLNEVAPGLEGRGSCHPVKVGSAINRVLKKKCRNFWWLENSPLNY